MARYIHCEDCKNKMSANAKKFNELYESLEGAAKVEVVCDACYTNILPGGKCFAAVLLDNKNHRNYESHKPEAWATGFMAIKN